MIRDARTEEVDDVVRVLHLAYQYLASPMPVDHASEPPAVRQLIDRTADLRAT